MWSWFRRENVYVEVWRSGALAHSVKPHQLPGFRFQHGDELKVRPLLKAAMLPSSWQDVCVPIGAGHAMRIPPEFRLFEYKGFRVPEHLIRLTGAGPDTFDLIGRAHIKNYERQMGLFPDMTFLDIGCGVGRDAFQLLDFLSERGRYVGIDVTQDSIDWCRQNITVVNPNFQFHHFDARSELYNPHGTRKTTDFRLPVPDASVDRIGLASVFTHLFEEEVVHYMADFARTLTADGLAHATFFLYTPEAIAAAATNGTTAWKATFAEEIGDGVFVNDPAHPRGAVAYSDAAMRRMMQRAGLVTDRPYVKGAWSGVYGAAAEEGQDAVILRRA